MILHDVRKSLENRWSDEKPPIRDISYYDHITMDTPFGLAIIEYKSWKKGSSFDLSIGGEWVGYTYCMESIKDKFYEEMYNRYNNLKQFLYDSVNN